MSVREITLTSRRSLRSDSVADRLVKQIKRKAAQERFERVKTGDEELTNVLHFNYLEVM